MTIKIHHLTQKESSIRKWILRILSLLIPAGIFGLSMLLAGAAPFGDETILLFDSVGQYIDFIGYFKTVLTGENDLFYTLSKTLGGDFLSLASYYLLSPFNLLFLLSNNQNIPMFYTAVAVLKLSACGATFYYASEKREGAKFSHLLFSTAYALMAYNVLNQWNLMWLDGVIVLPLLGLGVERIWENKSPLLYIFSLAYALATNFYIGYMLCIASVLFSLARLVLHTGVLRQRCRLLGRYVFASCAGGLTSAFIWLPAFLSISKGRTQFDSSFFYFRLNFNPLQLLSKLVAGAGGPQQVEYGLPHIFCGTVILFLALVFFVSKKVPVKVRLVALCAVAVLTLSFLLRPADVAWHGFSPNNSFNYRYAFIWSYLVIMIARYALSMKLTESIGSCLIAAVPLAAVYALLMILDYDHVPALGIGLGACVLLALLLTVRLLDKKRLAGILLCAVGIVELAANCFMLLDGVVGEAWTLRMSQWNSQIPVITQAVDYVKQQDTGLYRMEKTFQRSHNDAMFFAYNGLSHFSSGERAFVPEFMEKMGMRNFDEIWAYYNTGSTAEADSLLGVKYVLSKSDLSEQKGYELLTQMDDVGIYRNNNALPLAMLSSPQIMEVPMDGEDYFALHNEIWSGLCGEDVGLLHPADRVSVTLVNLESYEDYAGNTVYTKLDSSREAALRYEITVTQQMPLYLYFSAPDTQNVTVRVNGQDKGAYFDVYRWDMTNTGTYQPGDTVLVELLCGDDTMQVRDSYFYYEDVQAFAMATEKVQASPVLLQKETSSRISGEISAREDGCIIFTIPYDKSWQLSIDGEPVQTEKALDTFIAARLTAGNHSFTLRYVTEGLYIGCALSLAAAAAIVLDAMRRRRSALRGDGSK